jgi:phosphatidylserine decarboxylase
MCLLHRKAFPLVVEGIPLLIPPAVITVIGGIWWKMYLFVPFLVLTLFGCSFFRNPPRRIPDDDGLILSPADGRIVGVERGTQETKVSIFMSIFNCHVNRAPTAGTIEAIRYRPGRFLPANKEEASRQNEQNALELLSTEGLRLTFVQVAGIIARRIVCYVRRGDGVQRGEIIGSILFGSRLDIYLPPQVAVKVREGQRVKGGESIVGVIQ